MQMDDSPVSAYGGAGDKQWEMMTPGRATNVQATPYTPRTLAFNTLDRQLPLRANPQYAPPPQEKKGRWG